MSPSKERQRINIRLTGYMDDGSVGQETTLLDVDDPRTGTTTVPSSSSSIEYDFQGSSRWQQVLSSSIWLSISVFLIWLSDIIPNIVHFNPKINTYFFVLGCLFALGFIGIFIYLNYYVPYKETSIEKWRIYSDWQRMAPRAIPCATLFGFLTSLSYWIAFWPIYHWMTIPYFFVWGISILVILSYL